MLGVLCPSRAERQNEEMTILVCDECDSITRHHSAASSESEGVGCHGGRGDGCVEASDGERADEERGGCEWRKVRVDVKTRGGWKEEGKR
ncbi:hypothetical protein BLNAU_16859 [Blattamonas nauphoetae]|uniref:Uncharacterized protein n=1 Tax=Blattamonas nauphoetae TaxID=2049346 RepID=A0ABQ9XAI5_9EUKA|nr:hypothetical protein BLNAU_16859 [Blattamonas nauphoetae]